MRSPALDVLRAVALLLVFGHHTGMPVLARVGWVGVDLFFVLSGFLVSGLLFSEYRKTGFIRPFRFLARRGLKIYPQFYFLMGVTFAGMFRAGIRIQPEQAEAELGFFQNYAGGIWDHTWSLAVEEHFYLLLVAWIFWMTRRRFEHLPKWIVSVCLAILLGRVATWLLIPGGQWIRHVTPSHLRLDSLLVGTLLAYYHQFRASDLQAFATRYGAWLPATSMALLSPVIFLDSRNAFIFTVGFSIISIAFALMLITALHPRQVSKGGLMAELGKISYAFYLWHVPVLSVVLRARQSPLPQMIVTFAVTLCIAVATTRLIEAPVLRWRDRIAVLKSNHSFNPARPAHSL